MGTKFTSKGIRGGHLTKVFFGVTMRTAWEGQRTDA